MLISLASGAQNALSSPALPTLPLEKQLQPSHSTEPISVPDAQPKLGTPLLGAQASAQSPSPWNAPAFAPRAPPGRPQKSRSITPRGRRVNWARDGITILEVMSENWAAYESFSGKRKTRDGRFVARMRMIYALKTIHPLIAQRLFGDDKFIEATGGQRIQSLFSDLKSLVLGASRDEQALTGAGVDDQRRVWSRFGDQWEDVRGLGLSMIMEYLSHRQPFASNSALCVVDNSLPRPTRPCTSLEQRFMCKSADLQCGENSSTDGNDDPEQPRENIDGGDDDGDVSDFGGLGEVASVPSANEDYSLNMRAAAERQGVLSGIPQGVVVDESSVFREGLASGTRRGFELPSGPPGMPEMRGPSVAGIIPSVDYPSASAAAGTHSGSTLRRSSTPCPGSILREARARSRPVAPTSSRRKRDSSDTGEDARVSLYGKVSDVLDYHQRTKRVRESADMVRTLALQ
jgi:hypothetical protein